MESFIGKFARDQACHLVQDPHSRKAAKRESTILINSKPCNTTLLTYPSAHLLPRPTTKKVWRTRIPQTLVALLRLKLSRPQKLWEISSAILTLRASAKFNELTQTSSRLQSTFRPYAAISSSSRILRSHVARPNSIGCSG